MNLQQIKSAIRQNIIFYLTGFFIILGLKYFYSKADSNDLIWILAPTAWWVRILSGIPFWYESGVGYVNYGLRFIIAPSCSGAQFMIITIATLIFSFVHRITGSCHLQGRKNDCFKKGFLWIGGVIVFSYVSTVFVNGLRIILSIYVPLYLDQAGFYSRWLTQERLHTLIGTAVYFTSLLTIYHIAESVFQKAAFQKEALSPDGNLEMTNNTPDHFGHLLLPVLCKCMPPVFWYFLIVLGVPFLNNAYKSGYQKFMDFAALISFVCLTVVSLFCLIFMTIKKRYHGKSAQVNAASTTDAVDPHGSY